MLFIFLYILFVIFLINFFWIEFNDSIVLNFFIVFFFFFFFFILKNFIKNFLSLKFLKFFFILRFLLYNLFFFLIKYRKIFFYIQQVNFQFQIILNNVLSIYFLNIKNIYMYFFNFFYYLLMFQIFFYFLFENFKIIEEEQIHFDENWIIKIFHDSILFS